MLQIRTLFSPGEPVHQQNTGSNHTRFNTKRQQDHKCMTEVEICEEYMRNSNIYLTGVSKKLKKLKYYKITQADFIAYSYNLLPAVAVEKHKPVGTIAYTVTNQQQYLSTAEHCDNIIFKNFEPKI